MVDSKYSKKCEYCGRIFYVQKKSLLDKRRYCLQECSYNCPNKRKRTSETLKSSPAIKRHFTEKGREALRKGAQVRAKRRHEEWLNSPAVIVNGWNKTKAKLDITNRDLQEYRKKQQVCEICGRKETAKKVGKDTTISLAADHDHTNNKFRGLLCRRCNRALGWYDNYKDNIADYLAKTSC